MCADIKDCLLVKSFAFPFEFISLSEISVVNLIVGLCLLARTINPSTSFLLTFYSENSSSMYPFHSRGRGVYNINYCLTEHVALC